MPRLGHPVRPVRAIRLTPQPAQPGPVSSAGAGIIRGDDWEHGNRCAAAE